MLRSMTGFGVSTAEQGGRQYSVEVRSVNNKFFKAIVRVPPSSSRLSPISRRGFQEDAARQRDGERGPRALRQRCRRRGERRGGSRVR
jgi:uncharacterized protein YicC (UPF0701 family)